MAKTTSQSQGAFSFFEEVGKVEPVAKPRKNTLKPPSQIELVEESDTVAVPAGEDDIQDTPETTVPQPEESREVAFSEQETGLPEDIAEKEWDRFPAPGNDTNNTGEVPAEDKIAGKKSSRGRKSVKEHSIAAEIIEMPDDEALFSKHYYSMGEVTAMFNENHSLIRYWESEFDILKPKKNGKGDRFFRPVDVKNLYLIYDLLRRRKFTIEGAREFLKNNKKADEKFAAIRSLEKIRSFFLELKAGL